MSKPQTEDEILFLLNNPEVGIHLGSLGITELIKMCTASPMTVRAYVEKMTKDGKLIRDPVTKKYSINPKINDAYQGT